MRYFNTFFLRGWMKTYWRNLEEHLKKSKSSRDSYLDLRLSVKIFEIYLVTQSLEGDRIMSFNCFIFCSGEEREEEVVVVYSRHCSGSVEWAR
jgi:hypothetical protein